MWMKIGIGIIASLVGWGVIDPASLGSVTAATLAGTSRYAGWLYLWVVAAAVFLCLFLAFSHFGSITLGDDDEEPEYSRSAWFAMLFATGMAIGLVFFGVAEPISHYANPPPGLEPLTDQAANAAMRYSFFHWGLHPWAIYCVVGLSMAFFQFRRKQPASIGQVVAQLPYAPPGTAGFVDMLAVIATTFGIATSLGFGALQINAGLNAVFGMPVGVGWQVGIVAVTTVLFLSSALTGLDRGIKWLSSINLWLAAALALTIFVVGPTVAILDTFTNTLGSYISEFIRMSLRLTPFSTNSWVSDWTVFYWAWWISWSPFVGLFIARVSRGRTIREFVVGALLVPALVAWIWFSIFGGTALSLQIFQDAPLVEAVQSNIATALFVMFEALPLSMLLSVVATALLVIFFVTSGDSGVYVLSMLSSKSIRPSPRSKLMWGGLIAGSAIALLLAGGLKALQSAAITFALPFTVVIALMCWALYRELVIEVENKERADRALRRRLKAQVAARSDNGA